MTDKYQQRRESTKTEHWKKLKRQVIAERGNACEHCGTDKKIYLHHKHYDTLFEETPEDVTLLCLRCHMSAHGITLQDNSYELWTEQEEEKLMSLEQQGYSVYEIAEKLARGRGAICSRLRLIRKSVGSH